MLLAMEKEEREEDSGGGFGGGGGGGGGGLVGNVLGRREVERLRKFIPMPLLGAHGVRRRRDG